MAAILAQFEEDLLVFTAAGIASILVFHEKATGMFSIIPDDHDDDLEQAMKTVVKQVKRETDMIPHNKHEYQRRMNINLAEEYTSETMMNFLTKLCPKITHPTHKSAVPITSNTWYTDKRKGTHSAVT